LARHPFENGFVHDFGDHHDLFVPYHDQRIALASLNSKCMSGAYT